MLTHCSSQAKKFKTFFTDSPRSGSQLPGGQRVSWSQIFRWVVGGALTRNTGGSFTENQTLPNLTHCKGWKAGASWTEHTGGPWMASQWLLGLCRGPTPAPAAFGAKANDLICVTVIFQVIHRVLQIWFSVVQVRVMFYSCSRLEHEKHLWLLSSLLFLQDFLVPLVPQFLHDKMMRFSLLSLWRSCSETPLSAMIK